MQVHARLHGAVSPPLRQEHKPQPWHFGVVHSFALDSLGEAFGEYHAVTRSEGFGWQYQTARLLSKLMFHSCTRSDALQGLHVAQLLAHHRVLLVARGAAL